MLEATETARGVVAAFIKAGIKNFVLCPGSRSAPLALALAAAEQAGLISLEVEIDERVAAFIALGMGKAGQPAAVVTTSGTAVANLHPAVAEALHSGLPLLLLTADRPPELQQVRANQTTDHCALLAASVKYQVQIPPPAVNLAQLENQITRAVRIMLGQGIAGASGPGPVHINIGFRPPLIPEDLEKAGEWQSICADCTAVIPQAAPKRTVVVAGSDNVFLDKAEVEEFSRRAGAVPFLVEPSSKLRNSAQAIPAHQLLLRTQLRQKIERVVVVGHPTLTREVAELLADPQVEVVVVDEYPTYTDISGNAAAVVALEEVFSWLTGSAEWLEVWKDAGREAQHCCSEYLAAGHPLDFPQIALLLSESAVPTFLGASSIIRAVNTFAPVPGPVFFANRGLAGIDGVISTARGMASVVNQPMRVVVGDLSFIHDLGSLVATQNQPLPDLQVVVIDDQGGSLFATLEYGKLPQPLYNRVFRTAKDFSVPDFFPALKERVHWRECGADVSALRRTLAEPITGLEMLSIELAGDLEISQQNHGADLGKEICARVEKLLCSVDPQV